MRRDLGAEGPWFQGCKLHPLCCGSEAEVGGTGCGIVGLCAGTVDKEEPPTFPQGPSVSWGLLGKPTGGTLPEAAWEWGQMDGGRQAQAPLRE